MARIQITISAENAQAIAALKQVAGVAEQAGDEVEKAGADSGVGFADSFKEIVAYSKQAVAAIKDIAEAANQTANSIRSTGNMVQQGFAAIINEGQQAVAALRDVAGSASQVGSSVSQAGQAGSAGLDSIEQAAAEVKEEMQDAANAAQKAGADVNNAGQKGADGLEATAVAADDVRKNTQKAGAAGTKAGNEISSGGKKGADSLNQAGKNAESLGQKLANVTIVAGGITVVLNKVKEAFAALVKPGIDFAKQTEISRLGIAGVLMSMTKLNGEATKLPDALALSNKAIGDLTQSSGQIGLPLNELTETFQAVVGAGLTQKMTMKEIVDFTVIGTKAVKTMMTGVGNESMQVIQELRSMISGNIDQNSQVARSLGITNADIEKAKQSAGGLFKYLEDKLSGFAEIVKLYPDTLKGKIDRLTTVFQQVSSQGAEPFTEVLKQGLDAITEQLLVTETIVTDTGQTLKTVKLNPELIADLKDGSKYVADLIKDGINFGVTLSQISSGPASVLLSVIKLILDHAGQVTFTLLAWMGIQKVITIFRLIAEQILAVRAAAITAGSAITRMEASTVLLGRAMRSVLVTTGWGLLAVAIGYVADKMFNLYENTEKARKAKKGLFSDEDKGLGSLSAKYESNGDAGTIADNPGDAGGKSYGAWQLSKNMGTLQQFVDWLNKTGWEAGKFLTRAENAGGIPGEHDVTLGSAEFDDLWQQAAEKYGESFLTAQKEFIKENFYDVGVEQAKSVYLDLEKRSAALKDVIWSAAVQHGPGNIAELLQQAASLMKQPNASYLTDEDLIKAIYAVRSSDEWTNGSPDYRPALRERFHNEMNDALMRLSKESPISAGQGNLELRNPKDEAEAIAKAKIALAEAMSNQEIQKYIEKLQADQKKLDQRKQATEGGFTSEALPAISREEYSQQTALITRAIAEAEIKKLETERAHLQELLTNNNLSGAEDPINIQTQITQKGTEIATARNKLAEALQQLGFEDAQAQKELLDKVTDMEVQLLEAQGKIAEANRLRTERERQALITRFQANGQTGAIDTVTKLYDTKQAHANFEQAQKDIEVANGELVTTQINLLNDLATGAKTAQQVMDEYTNEYNAKMQAILAELRQQLTVAVNVGDRDLANKIRAAIREIGDKISEFFDKVIQRIDAELQHEIAMINADRNLTSMQKQDKIDEATRKAAADRAARYEDDARRIRNTPDQDGNIDWEKVINLENAAALNRELAKMPTFIDKIREAGKQGFEDGLLDFFERGIIECNKFGDAIRNLAITVLQSIQKIYAQEMTRRIMGLFNPGGLKTTDPWSLSDGTKLDPTFGFGGNFAEGGSVMESGLVKGPGTSTSDSILAWVDNIKKWIRVGDGEWIVRGAAVKKYGTRFLEAINSGRVPVHMLQKYATGGSLTDRSVAAAVEGPHELSAALTSNSSTTIPLSIMNVFDPGIMEKFAKTREGKKAIINVLKEEATLVRRILER